MATSTEILAPQSYALTSELPFMQFVKIKCLNNKHVVQKESLLSLSSSNSFHSITEFCSESKDATPNDCPPNSMHIDLVLVIKGLDTPQFHFILVSSLT